MPDRLFPAKIGLVWLSGIKMKTTSIFICVVMFVLCVCASVRTCICTESKDIQTISKLLNEAADLCSDCGHSKTCCGNQTDIPTVDGLAITIFFNTCTSSDNISLPEFHVATRKPVRSGSLGNRAPPWSRTATLLEIHQKLSA